MLVGFGESFAKATQSADAIATVKRLVKLLVEQSLSRNEPQHAGQWSPAT